MKAKLLSTGRIYQVSAVEKTSEGIIYDLRMPGSTLQVFENEVEIQEGD